MRYPLATLLLVLGLVPLHAGALDVEEFEQGAPGAEGEDGGAATVDAVVVAPGGEPARVMATARGGQGGPAGAATPAGDGGSAALGRVYGASGSGEVAVFGAAVGGAGGAQSDAFPGGDGAPVRLEDAVDGETSGTLSLVQLAHGGDAGGAGGRPGGAESILERSKRAEALTLGASAVAGGAVRDIFTVPIEFGAPGGDATTSVRGSNRGGSTTVVGLALAGPGGIGLSDRVSMDGGDAELFAAGTTRCSGCPVRVGQPSPPRYAPRPTGFSFGRIDFAPAASGAVAGTGGGGFLPGVGGNGGRASSLSIGRALRDAAVTVFDVARGAVGGTSLDEAEGARGGDAQSVAFGAGRGRSPVEVHADAEGGAAGLRFPLIGTTSGVAVPVAVPGGSALASADAEGGGRVVADARAAAGAGQRGERPGASAEAWASAVGRSAEVRAAAGSFGYNLDVEVRAIAELASQASSGARAATGASLPRRPREADVYARSASAPPEAAVLESRLPDGLLEALQANNASIEAIGELGGERPEGHGPAGARLVFEVDLRSTALSTRSRVTGVRVGLGAPRLPRRGFEALRVTVTREQEILFDATYHDRDEARRELAGRLLEVGSLGALLESQDQSGYGMWPRQTLRPELARLRVELTGYRSTDEFALRYAVAASPYFVLAPVPPGGGYIELPILPRPQIGLTPRVAPLPVRVLPDLFLPALPGADGFNDLTDRNDAGDAPGGALAPILRLEPGATFSTTPTPPDLSGL